MMLFQASYSVWRKNSNGNLLHFGTELIVFTQFLNLCKADCKKLSALNDLKIKTQNHETE
jgi:hypothetical protein